MASLLIRIEKLTIVFVSDSCNVKVGTYRNLFIQPIQMSENDFYTVQVNRQLGQTESLHSHNIHSTDIYNRN